jgi:hypothetical protein
MATFNIWAPPMAFGPWTVVASHGGPVGYTIDMRVLGSTVVIGEVKYYGARGERVEQFRGQTHIRTGNAWGNVRVRFRGVPLGSSVEVRVSP